MAGFHLTKLVPVLAHPANGHPFHCWLCGATWPTVHGFEGHRPLDGVAPAVCHTRRSKTKITTE
jgi:hypothetical protein